MITISFFDGNLTKLLGIIFGIAVLLFLCSTFYLYRRSHNKNLNYEFTGKVEAVQYDIKGTPTVTINGKSYFLSYNGWAFDNQIEKDDTLKKKKGTLIIMLIKHGSKKVLYLGN